MENQVALIYCQPMRLTILRMLSTNSLQAFSGAATTAPIGRTGATEGVRLARAQPEAAARQATPMTSAIPDSKPTIPPARGSLLNLSV